MTPNSSGFHLPDAGTIQIKSAKGLAQEEQNAREKKLAEEQAAAPIQGLVSYVRSRWQEAKDAKRPVAKEMRSALRRRRGRYDDDKLQEIKSVGGSEIWMGITGVKCRAAAAWLRDAMLGNGNDKPWGVKPTPIPTLNAQETALAQQEAQAHIMSLYQMRGTPPTPDEMAEIGAKIKQELLQDVRETARRDAEITEARMEDVMLEGGFTDALDLVLDDLVTFKNAFLRGPVVRKKAKLKWVESPAGGWVADISEQLVAEFERVSPFDMFPAPYSYDLKSGYLIHRHRLTRSALTEMLGVPGYSDNAIRECLKKYDNGAVSNWLMMGPDGEDYSMGATASDDKFYSTTWKNRLIDALEIWDNIPGRFLLEWGMSEEQIQDPDLEYAANVWLIDNYIIKAVLNHDPLGEIPYSMASFEKIPGRFWGQGIPDLIRDVQDVCNASARALVNNMGMSSGPQVVINVERIPEGQKISSMHPWKIWQMVSDPIGSTAPPVDFFVPPSVANELMAVYEKFSNLADEYSGLPKYLTGESTGGAGRTASGLSMMLGNASKLMKAVVHNVDDMVESILQRLHTHLLYHVQDPQISGDIDIIATGTDAVMQRDTLALRRNEFLVATANPIDSQIVGLPGRAYILSEQAKSLGMDPELIVKDPDVLAAEQAAQQMMMAQQAMAAQGGMPPDPAQTTPGMDPSLATQGGRPAVSQFDQMPRSQ